MKATQNQLERFCAIAKRIVDDHCAEMFTSSGASSGGDKPGLNEEVYHSHLNVLGKELNEQAAHFIDTYKTVSESVRSEIWDVCERYVAHFVKRNQPDPC